MRENWNGGIVELWNGELPVRWLARDFESGTALPHSKTLAHSRRPLELPPGFGVRQCCAALNSALRAFSKLPSFHHSIIPSFHLVTAGGAYGC